MKLIRKLCNLLRKLFMDNETLLLGAGASVEADIPNAFQMAEKIINKFNADPNLIEETKVLTFINEQLIAQAQKSDPSIDRVDVEALYNAVLALSERETLEISAFVDIWDPDLLKIKDPDKLFDNIMLKMERMLEELTIIKDDRKIDYLKPIRLC